MKTEQEYTVYRKIDEYYSDFLLRVANTIQAIDGKITWFSLDLENGENYSATIFYIEKDN